MHGDHEHENVPAQETPAQAEWLRPQQAAALLDVPTWRLKRWSNSELLPTYRTQGGHRRFVRADVERFGRNLPEVATKPVGIAGALGPMDLAT